MNLTNKTYLLNKMNATARVVQLGSLITGNYANETEVVSGTLGVSINLVPKASTANTGVNRHVLFSPGELTGTTAFGFGDVTKPTYGAMFSFGRTAIATASWTGTDTSVDIRCINKLVNNAAYAMQALYVKCKNYTSGTVGSLVGAYIETVADGTDTTAIGLKLGTDGSTIDTAIDMSACTVTNGSDIKLSTGITIGSGSAAPTHIAPIGSLYIRTGQADVKAVLYLSTVADGTWVLLNTVIA